MHGSHAMSGMSPHAGACTEPVPQCASSATPLFDKEGALRVIYAVGGRVYVARSGDDGRTFQPPVAISSAPANIDESNEGRPTLVMSQAGVMAAAWSIWRDKQWNAMVLFSRSLDGKTFSPPRPLAKSVSQRFPSLGFASDGTLWVTWLDKRNIASAKAAGDTYEGAALALSVSHDDGANFSPSVIVSDRTCECCRISLAFDPDGGPVASWRQIYGKNFRDHEVGRFGADAKSVNGIRVSEDNWAIDACPHHGPSLSIDAAGTRHIAWYTGGGVRKGLFYAHEAGQNAAFSAPQPFGDNERTAQHPQVLAHVGALVRAWKEFDGETTAILFQASYDNGDAWTPAKTIATTRDASDHPILIAKGERIFLSWLTKEEGYRLMPLPLTPER
ncbi:MAG: exo-alpha-sialidase [Methylobacteriaceae bacterium]|nr:exo-alpha-sialidase [Methylobacteriaceae bacterium]